MANVVQTPIFSLSSPQAPRMITSAPEKRCRFSGGKRWLIGFAAVPIAVEGIGSPPVTGDQGPGSMASPCSSQAANRGQRNKSGGGRGHRSHGYGRLVVWAGIACRADGKSMIIAERRKYSRTAVQT